MNITNYLDFKLITNLSVSISISLFIVFILGKVVTDNLSDFIKIVFKHFVRSLIKKFFPIRFIVGFPEDRVTSSKFIYHKNKIINFGKLNQPSLPAYGIDIFVQANTKFPSIYKGSKIRVQLSDPSDLLGIYSAAKLPGKPTTFSLAEFTFENSIVNHIHIDFKPTKLFDNRQIPIYVFFEGKAYSDFIEITVTKEK